MEYGSTPESLAAIDIARAKLPENDPVIKFFHILIDKAICDAYLGRITPESLTSILEYASDMIKAIRKADTTLEHTDYMDQTTGYIRTTLAEDPASLEEFFSDVMEAVAGENPAAYPGYLQ